MTPFLIKDIDDPRIELFKSLKNTYHSENLFIAESEKVVLKLLKTSLKIRSVFCEEKYISLFSHLDISLFYAKKDLFKKIIGNHIHQGLMVLFEGPEAVKIEDLEDRVLVLNGLTSPENVGSIIRSAAAFDIRTIIVDQKTVSPYCRRCIRVSTGNVFFVKIYFSRDLKEDLIYLKNQNYSVISTANERDSSPLEMFRFPQKSALIIGSEGHGIEKSLLKISDFICKIKIGDDVKHLNDSIDACIFLWHWSLQKSLNLGIN